MSGITGNKEISPCHTSRPARRKAAVIVDQKGVNYLDCKNGLLPYGRQLVDDVLNRTETGMPQACCYWWLSWLSKRSTRPRESTSDGHETCVEVIASNPPSS